MNEYETLYHLLSSTVFQAMANGVDAKADAETAARAFTAGVAASYEKPVAKTAMDIHAQLDALAFNSKSPVERRESNLKLQAILIARLGTLQGELQQMLEQEYSTRRDAR